MPRGFGETPAKIRMQQSHARLKAAGGRRSSFNLSEDVSSALAQIKVAQGYKTDQAAFEFAVLQTAAALEGMQVASEAPALPSADLLQCSGVAA